MQLQRRLEKIVVDTIEGRSVFLRPVLYLCSLLFRSGVAIRHCFYKWGIFKTHTVPKKVICVGNLVAGGTGKTPIVALLAQTLSQKNRIAIVSRGYRSKIERSNTILEVSSSMSAALCGDEPLMLKKKIPAATIIVGKDRVRAAQKADRCALIILDDGMQHLRLHRDFTIIVVDSHDPFGKGHFLPRGYLRDHPKRLKIADLIIAHHIRDESHFKQIQDSLSPFSGAPVIGTRLEIKEDLKEGKAGVFSAIGKPHHLMTLLSKHKVQGVNTFFKPDHLSFNEKELATFAEESRLQGARSLICTEKDEVKIPGGLTLCLPITSVKTEIKIVYGQEHWYNLLKKIDQ